ncbi:UNVERIFIED_CONTAM: hypothetical protein FKN15_045586 [Acipenser sinensis]
METWHYLSLFCSACSLCSLLTGSTLRSLIPGTEETSVCSVTVPWFRTPLSSVVPPGVDPAQCVSAADSSQAVLQDGVAGPPGAVQQPVPCALELLQQAVPETHHPCLATSHLEPSPVQVHRHYQLLDPA